VHDKFTEYKLVEGKHEPLISKDTYERNIALLDHQNRKGEVHLRINPVFPLKGLLLCTYCSNTLYASSPRTGSGGHSPRYHCSRESCRGKAKSIKVEAVHEEFQQLLKRVKPAEGVLKLYKTILVREANNDVKDLNKRISIVRTRLDDIAHKRATAIQKFIDEQLTVEEKDGYIDQLDGRKVELSNDLRELENQQNLKEADIALAINVMEQVDKQWAESEVDLKVRFQSMLFPEGIIYDFTNKRFGTKQLSPLYRLIPTEKGAKAPSNSNLVAGRGLEPLTSWL
jgi:site-specific DNA recombinase